MDACHRPWLPGLRMACLAAGGGILPCVCGDESPMSARRCQRWGNPGHRVIQFSMDELTRRGNGAIQRLTPVGEPEFSTPSHEPKLCGVCLALLSENDRDGR